MKNFVKNGMIGMGIGATINMIIVALFNGVQGRSQIISVLLMSFAIGLLSNVFLLEKLSLLTRTIIQFIGTLGLFLVTGLYNQWFERTLSSLLPPLVIFIVLFVVLWIIFYCIEKKEIEQINAKIKKS